MKALTYKQPWASLICTGVKDIENRTWKTKFRGMVLIHAGKSILRPQECNFTNAQSDNIRGDMRYNILHSDLPTGAIIGSVEIVDCVINHESIWAEKSNFYTLSNPNGLPAFYGTKHKKKEDNPTYNWVLANPIKFDKPIPCKGKLRFWDFDETLIKEKLK